MDGKIDRRTYVYERKKGGLRNMTKDKYIAAESISSLLEGLHKQQRSGMLRAKYSQGGHIEEGEIYVYSGQPIYAHAGGGLGLEAFKYLLSWRNISFSFEINASRPKVNLPSSAYLGNTRALDTTVQFPPHVQMPMPTPQRFPTTDELRWNAMAGRSDFASSTSGPLGMDRLVPQKVGPNRDDLVLSLSRRERHIYFMVDGRRTVSDLARCINKTVPEVELILSELQKHDLVAI